MGYIKKEIQNLIKSMDETFSIDLGVRNWLKQSIYPKHNLILKSKDGYYCTNCKKTFHSTAKVGDYLVCPKCKESLLVRMNTLKYQVFKDDFRILDYINGYFVLRGFEVSSTYSNNKVTHRYQEYQDNASLIITSLLHISTPCVAYGIPVILARDLISYRFSWLDKLLPIYSENDYEGV